MIIDLAIKKNRIDGNIYSYTDVQMNDESIRTFDTNAVVDSLECIFDLEDSTVENIVTPIAASYTSSA